MTDEVNSEEMREIPSEEMLPEENLPLEDEILGESVTPDEGSAEPYEHGEEAASDEEKKVEVVGIRFRKSGKIYYFDPAGLTFDVDSHAVVETARGTEYGRVAVANQMISVRDVVQPLRPVLRAATPEDDRHYEENGMKEVEAFNICIEKIAAHHLEMKLVDVEYTFDNNKLLFYFTAEGRVDFRELVKDLASVFRTRIELRQIGIRDEAKLMGGLGVCGRPFCCHLFLSDFVQVSIKMAKEQNLSLNSAKISGACGRLMCCLRYENDVYEEECAKTPPVDSVVTTPDGDGVVVETMPLQGRVKVRSIAKPDVAPKVYSRDDVTVQVGVKPEPFVRRGRDAGRAKDAEDKAADDVQQENGNDASEQQRGTHAGRGGRGGRGHGGRGKGGENAVAEVSAPEQETERTEAGSDDV